MTLEKFLLVSFAACAMAACAPAAKDAAEETPPAEQPASEPASEEPIAEAPASEPTDEDQCKSAEYQSLVGSNVAAITLPADLVHRIYKQGDVITMDYRPDRLNIATDENGVVIEVKCG